MSYPKVYNTQAPLYLCIITQVITKKLGLTRKAITSIKMHQNKWPYNSKQLFQTLLDPTDVSFCSVSCNGRHTCSSASFSTNEINNQRVFGSTRRAKVLDFMDLILIIINHFINAMYLNYHLLTIVIVPSTFGFLLVALVIGMPSYYLVLTFVQWLGCLLIIWC